MKNRNTRFYSVRNCSGTPHLFFIEAESKEQAFDILFSYWGVKWDACNQNYEDDSSYEEAKEKRFKFLKENYREPAISTDYKTHIHVVKFLPKRICYKCQR